MQESAEWRHTGRKEASLQVSSFHLGTSQIKTKELTRPLRMITRWQIERAIVETGIGVSNGHAVKVVMPETRAPGTVQRPELCQVPLSDRRLTKQPSAKMPLV